MFTFICEIVVVLLTMNSTLAQSSSRISVRAELPSSTLYIGDPTVLRVTVDGSKSPDEPDLKGMPGFDVEYLGGVNTSQTSIMIINGRRQDNSSESFTFQYKITPTRTGKLRIPSIALIVDGKTYSTSEIEVEVSEPKVAEGFTLVLEPDKKALYLGEPVRVQVLWYLGSSVKDVSFSMPSIDEFELRTPQSSLPSVVMQRINRAVEIPFLTGKVAGLLSERDLDGKSYTTVSFDQILIPKKAGTLTIGPLRVACRVAVGKRARRFTDSPFDDLTEYDRRVLESRPLTLEVKPLPTPAPSNFTGLVGNYSIDASASPTVLNVGEPITLTVRIAGPEPMDRVPPLELERRPEFTRNFRMPADTTLPTITPTAAIYSLTMRPRSDAVKEVPAIELPYFNPATAKYEVARSRPLSLKVQATKEVTLDDERDEAAASTAEKSGEPSPNEEPQAPKLHQSVDLSQTSDKSLHEQIRESVVAIVIGGPVVLYAILVGIAARQRAHAHDPAARRRGHAFRRARRRLARAGRVGVQGQTSATVADALRGFAADMMNVPEFGLTSRECSDYFRHADTDHGAKIAGILEQCDESQFAGTSVRQAPVESLARDAAWSLSQLVQRQKRRRA